MDIKEKKAKKSTKALLRFFLYALCGTVCALPITFPHLWPLGWVGLCPVFYHELFSVKEKDSYKAAYGRGMSFFWFFSLLNFHWLINLYPLDFLGFDKGSALVVVLCGTLGFPLLQGAVSSLIFVFIAFIRKRGLLCRYGLLSALLFACLFTVAEQLQTFTWAGVPWGRFAVGQCGFLPVIQSVSLFGCGFIAFIMTLFSALLAVAAGELRNGRRKRALLSLCLAFSVFFSNLIFGTVSLKDEGPEPDVTVGLVQGNIRFEDKWAGKAEFTLDTYRELTLECAEEGAELILWPETALPYDCTENPFIFDYFSDVGKECGCECLVSVFESDGERLYNTVRSVDGEGRIGDTVYKKRHLVPFGEYVPMEKLIRTLIPPLGELCSAMDQISPGEGTEIIETANGRVGTLICFDSVYEELCTQSVRDGAQLLCVATNDSWFSGTCALTQHASHAVLRSVEHGRYTVRCANTGISSVISPKGETVATLGDSERGSLCAKVAFLDTDTLYTRIGNSFVLLCCAALPLYFMGALIYERKKRGALHD